MQATGLPPVRPAIVAAAASSPTTGTRQRYGSSASLQQARVLRYRVQPETGYLPDLDELAALAPGARVLVVNSPSKPPGAGYDRATLATLYELARPHALPNPADEV